MRLTLEQFNKLKQDFPTYCALNIRIKNKSGKLQMLVLNKMQRRLWNLFLEEKAKNNPTGIKWYLTKMRQGGASTFFLALFYWLTTLNANKNVILIAHDGDAAEGMMNKIQTFHLRSERILKPNTRKINRKELHFANPIEDAERTGDVGLDSRIDVSTIDSKAIGRSYTYQCALLTEFAIYPELGIDIDDRMVALFNAVPDDPDSLIILESTAQGENAAKDFWDDNQNGFRKIFISWIADDTYRIECSIDEYFELSELPDSRYGDEIRERENIIREIKFWHPYLQTEYEIEHETMCRLAWRRRTIDTKLRGNKSKFRQEYPTTVEDAFATSTNSIFSTERILEIEDQLNNLSIKPKKYRYQHDDTTKDPTRKFYEAVYGHLHIYNAPQTGIHYVVGADGAQGVDGGDDSTAYVLRLPELEEVAMFSDIIRPEEFAGVLNYLSLLYNKALLGVELNDKGGYAAVEKLVNHYYYPNLYYQINPFKSKISSDIRYGWHTNEITRQIMIRDFADVVENNNIIIKSKKLLTQMKSFVILPNGKAAALSGKHDDVVISAMIAVQMARQVHIPRAIIPRVAPKGSPDWHIRQLAKKRERHLFGRS
jgi:hypothetical protein